jgi:hypothetical protein
MPVSSGSVRPFGDEVGDKPSVRGSAYLRLNAPDGPMREWSRLPPSGCPRRCLVRQVAGRDGSAPEGAWRGLPGKGPPPAGFFRAPRPMAILRQTSQPSWPRSSRMRDEERSNAVRTGVTFTDVAEDWLLHGERERDWKRSTVVDYRSAVRAHLLPAFGSMPVERVTTRAIEAWRSHWLIEHRAPRQAGKLVALLHAIFERARRTYGLSDSPAAQVEWLRVRYDPSAYDFYSPEEVAPAERLTVQPNALLDLLRRFLVRRSP